MMSCCPAIRVSQNVFASLSCQSVTALRMYLELTNLYNSFTGLAQLTYVSLIVLNKFNRGMVYFIYYKLG